MTNHEQGSAGVKMILTTDSSYPEYPMQAAYKQYKLCTEAIFIYSNLYCY